MVLRDDTLMRQIEKLVAALLTMRKQQLLGVEEPDADKLDELLAEWSGMPRALLEGSSAGGLVDAMSPAGKLDVTRAVAVGLLLEERGDSRGAELLRVVEAQGGARELERIRERLSVPGR